MFSLIRRVHDAVNAERLPRVPGGDGRRGERRGQRGRVERRGQRRGERRGQRRGQAEARERGQLVLHARGQLEALAPPQEGAVLEHVQRGGVQRPVGPLARPLRSSGDLNIIHNIKRWMLWILDKTVDIAAVLQEVADYTVSSTTH